MTFSRYAGPGSHRYPVGFSGDTVVTWESLKFQPYFTSTASNIGYGWWSHDIGGHMNGYKDDELEGRWYQLGVFSPVNRLHSTKNEFNGKEPWRFNPEIHSMMNEFLQLRHKMVPYLYTMNYRAYAQDTPLVLPMYYYNPRCLESYRVPNEYYFGTGLIVAPITSPRLSGLNRAKERVWLPEGTFIDFFSGTIYEGGRMMDMYRDINTMPVFAKAGAVIPMTEEIDAVSTCGNPSSLTLKVYAGADGSFSLYEDDNETCDYEKGICAITEFEWKWDGEQRFAVHPVQGELSLVPEKRDYTIEIWGCTESEVLCTSNGKTAEAEASYDADKNCLKITVSQADACAETVITFVRKLVLADNPVKKTVYAFLDQAEMEFDIKTRIYQLVCSGKSPLVIIGELQAMDLSEDLVKCISEMLTAQGSLA